MKWLAWCPDYCDRDEARQAPIWEGDARDVAVGFAERSYSREPFDKYMNVTVIAVADDGTETTHEFTVDVEHEPVFRARART